MPGVYTASPDSSEIPTSTNQQLARKPKAPSGDQMSARASREEVRGASPLIDLTSRSPSPSFATGSVSGTTQRTAPIQLSTYAQPAQTRVNKTSPPHPLPPARDNHSTTTHSITLTAPPPNYSSTSSSTSSSSVITSLPEMEAGVGHSLSLHSTQSAISTEPGSGSVTNTTTTVSNNEAPVVDGATNSHHPPSVVPQSTPQDQPQVATITSQQTTTGAKGRSQDSAPPALVEYVTSPANGSDATPHETLPRVKSEPSLGFGADLTPHELEKTSVSHQMTSNVATVTGHIQSGSIAEDSNVESAPNCSQPMGSTASALPPKVGVASIQVGVVSPGNQTTTMMTSSEEEFPRLRMASLVGGEESEGGGEGEEGEGETRERAQAISSFPSEVQEEEEEEEEEEEGDEMQLRIEDSVMELDEVEEECGDAQISQPHSGQLGVGSRDGKVGRGGGEGGGVRENNEDLVMDTGSHSNSIGTSPPPPPQPHVPLVAVRVHGRAGGEARVRIADGVRGSRGEEHSGVKYSKQLHYRSERLTGSHGNTNSLLMKASVATVSPSLMRDNDRGSMDERAVFGGGGRVHNGEKGGVVSSTGENGDILASSYRVRKVAKVKQFFTTLQRFGDRQSSEVAEQVQELIAALVNGTATIEEFHQEIQTVTNHPLRQFIIPFLRENLDLFREALRDSEQALADILSHPPSSSSSSSSIAVTPQLIDEDLPVLPSSKPPLTPTLSSHSSSSLPLTAAPATSVSSIHHSSSTNTTTNMHRSVHSQTHPVNTMNFDPVPESDSAQNSPIPRKRTRDMSTDRGTIAAVSIMQSDFHSTIITDKTLKRPRQDINHTQSSVSMDTVTMPTIRRGPIPSSGGPVGSSYLPPVLTPHQQHTSHSQHESVSLSHPPRTPTLHSGHTPSQILHPLPSRKQLLAEDWSYIDMMLNSVVGMVEKARNAMAILRERALNSNSDLEKREEQQRIAEVTEKARRHWQEEKIHLQREAARKLKETVAQVKADVEQRLAQAQSMAVQEALKEASTQSNSKESCWNCGRRATETCSGCNKARYCGTFCQHKDWGSHMHQCASGIAGMADDRSSSSSATTTRVIIQSSDARSLATEEPPDVKPRISPEQLMAVPQITVRYPMT